MSVFSPSSTGLAPSIDGLPDSVLFKKKMVHEGLKKARRDSTRFAVDSPRCRINSTHHEVTSFSPDEKNVKAIHSLPR